jgi:flagellar hook assembly protein FlgD
VIITNRLKPNGCSIKIMEKEMKRLTVKLCLILILTCFSLNLSAATYLVTNTNDTGAGSLRWAMTSANNSPGADTINFNIPGTGPHMIFPLSQLPVLTDMSGVVIDGLTEPGASSGANPPATATLMIEIDGANTGPAHGMWIMSSFNEIYGLVINNFEQDGIRIEGTLQGSNANFIRCNFIGVEPSGLIAQGNGTNQNMLWAGVNIIVTPSIPGIAMDNIVDGNLISDNYSEGVSISNCPPGDVAFNMVFDNYIGTDINGTTDLGNAHDGVYIGEGAHENVVDGNLISGNDFEGISIVGYAENEIYTFGNIIFNNIIGLDISLAPLGNNLDGVSIGQYGATWYQGGFATDNVVDSNIIAENGGNGVTVWEHPLNQFNCDHNIITRNSMYNNTLLGIDLGDNGVTTNDGGDPDLGPNEELNFPVITSADYSSGQTTVQGTVDIDTDPSQATVEIFKASQDPTNYGEGDVYLGATNPDGAGNWSTIVTGVIPGELITATTTDMNNNTSEFSQNVQVNQVGVEEKITTKHSKIELEQNYPNPFNAKTSINIHMTGKKLTPVTLNIYDISGRSVRKFILYPSSSIFSATVEWDGKNESGIRVSPGIYFYTLSIGKHKTTKKMILSK